MLRGTRIEPYEPEEVVVENVAYKELAGLKLIWQHGRAQIVKLPVEIARLTYELRRVRELIHARRTDISREERWIKYWEGEIEKERRRIAEVNLEFRRTIARLGAYARALRYRARLLGLFRRALEARVLPTPLLRAVARTIRMPVTWIRYHPEEAYRMLEEEVSRYMETYRKAREEYERKREERRRIIEESERKIAEYEGKIREHEENIEKFKKELDELLRQAEKLVEDIKAKKPYKEIVVDEVEHIMVEMTFSIETGGERGKGVGTVHQAVVAEAHARTEVQPMEMLHLDSIREILVKMETAVTHFLEHIYSAASVSGAGVPPDAIMKIGVRYVYQEPKRHEISWPTIEVEIEYYRGIPGRDYAYFYEMARKMAVRTGRKVTLFDLITALQEKALREGKIKEPMYRSVSDTYLIEYTSTPPYFMEVG